MSFSPRFDATSALSRANRPRAVHETIRIAPLALSSSALKLHVCAVVSSIYEQRPGLVTDAYLVDISDGIDSLVDELCGTGIWSRCDGGYAISEREVRR